MCKADKLCLPHELCAICLSLPDEANLERNPRRTAGADGDSVQGAPLSSPLAKGGKGVRYEN